MTHANACVCRRGCRADEVTDAVDPGKAIHESFAVAVVSSSIVSGTSLLYATLGELVGEHAGIVDPVVFQKVQDLCGAMAAPAALRSAASSGPCSRA